MAPRTRSTATDKTNPYRIDSNLPTRTAKRKSAFATIVDDKENLNTTAVKRNTARNRNLKSSTLNTCRSISDTIEKTDKRSSNISQKQKSSSKVKSSILKDSQLTNIICQASSELNNDSNQKVCKRVSQANVPAPLNDSILTLSQLCGPPSPIIQTRKGRNLAANASSVLPKRNLAQNCFLRSSASYCGDKINCIGNNSPQSPLIHCSFANKNPVVDKTSCNQKQTQQQCKSSERIRALRLRKQTQQLSQNNSCTPVRTQTRNRQSSRSPRLLKCKKNGIGTYNLITSNDHSSKTKSGTVKSKCSNIAMNKNSSKPLSGKCKVINNSKLSGCNTRASNSKSRASLKKPQSTRAKKRTALRNENNISKLSNQSQKSSVSVTKKAVPNSLKSDVQHLTDPLHDSMLLKSENVNLSLNISYASRPSKREQLARDLRDGKLEVTRLTNIPTIVSSPVVVLHTERTSYNKGCNKSKVRKPPKLCSLGNTVKTSPSRKLPVYAKVSPMKKIVMSRKRVSEIFDLSLNSNDASPAKKKKVRSKVRKRLVIEKPKLSTKSFKLLTTDPDFEKAFPSMFPAKSFYGNLTNLRTKCGSTYPERNLSPDVCAEIICYSDHDESEFEAEISQPSDEHSNSALNPDSVNSVPVSIESDNALCHNDNNCNSYSVKTSSASNIRKKDDSNINKKNCNSNNKAIPTPAALRLMSKLVGGTSTPCDMAIRNPALESSFNPVPTITFEASSPPEPAVLSCQPKTVADQIQVCFGFEESITDRGALDGTHDIESASLNLSPVRRSVVSQFPSNNCTVSSMSSMLSEVGRNVPRAGTSIAPTRWVHQMVHHLRTGVSQTIDSFVVPRNLESLSNSRPRGVLSTIAPKTNLRNFNELSLRNNNLARDPLITDDTRDNVSVLEGNGTAVVEQPSLVENVAEKSYLFLEENAVESPVNEVAPVEADTTALAISEKSPEKSFCKPPRHSYNRKSLERSRKAMLAALAGGVPTDDEEDAESEAEISDTRTATKVVRTMRNVNTDRRTKQIAQKMKQLPRAAEHLDDGGVTSSVTKCKHIKRKARVGKKTNSTPSKLPANTCARSTAQCSGKQNKKLKLNQCPDDPKQTELQAVNVSRQLLKQNNSSQCNKSSTSILDMFSLSLRIPVKKKNTNYERNLNDWASNVSSHFNEIEDYELVTD